MTYYSNCPLCHKPMMHSDFSRNSEFIKECRHPNHFLELYYRADVLCNVNCEFLSDKNITVIDWDMEQKVCEIVYQGRSIELPYFPPNLSELKELPEKIKKYLLFI